MRLASAGPVPGLSETDCGDGPLVLMYSVCFLKQDSTIIAQAGPEVVSLLTGLYMIR